MNKHLTPERMEKELRLAFSPPFEARIEYFDRANKMRFQVSKEDKKVIYKPLLFLMQGAANIRIPRFFKFRVSMARRIVEEKTGIKLLPWKLQED